MTDAGGADGEANGEACEGAGESAGETDDEGAVEACDFADGGADGGAGEADGKTAGETDGIFDDEADGEFDGEGANETGETDDGAAAFEFKNFVIFELLYLPVVLKYFSCESGIFTGIFKLLSRFFKVLRFSSIGIP